MIDVHRETATTLTGKGDDSLRYALLDHYGIRWSAETGSIGERTPWILEEYDYLPGEPTLTIGGSDYVVMLRLRLLTKSATQAARDDLGKMKRVGLEILEAAVKAAGEGDQ